MATKSQQDLIEATRKQPMYCVIPARGGSKRLKNKNKLTLCGKPLVQWTIEAALDSGLFDTIIVSSDDMDILEIAFEFFDTGKVQPHKRPSGLCGDDVPLKNVARFALGVYRAPVKQDFCILQPTNPLRMGRDIVKAYKQFKKENANFLVSVSKLSNNPADFDDGAITFAKTQAFIDYWHNNFYSPNCAQYLIENSLEIHTKKDFEKAECLMEKLSL